MRIGHGFDAHAFGGTRPLILGGIHIPHPQGLIANSDGDVILHAVMDALLGAAALGDIGKLFPDGEPAYQGIDSRLLLRSVFKLVKQHGFQLGNLDITVIAQTPMLADYIGSMREHLQSDLQCDRSCVSVKASTTDRLGFIGREEGIACEAVVLLQEISQAVP